MSQKITENFTYGQVSVGTGVLLAPTLGAQMNLTTTGTVYGVSVAGSAPVSFIDCN